MPSPLRRDALNSGDVFVLTMGTGTTVWQWNGSESNADERRRGGEVAKSMAPQEYEQQLPYEEKGDSEGGPSRARITVLDQGVNDSEEEAKDFWALLPLGTSADGISAIAAPSALGGSGGGSSGSGAGGVLTAAEGGDDDDVDFHVPVLWTWEGVEAGTRRTGFASASFDGTGKENESAMKFARRALDSGRVMLLDTGKHCFLWVGGSSGGGSGGGLEVAALGMINDHLDRLGRPRGLPVTILREGQAHAPFDQYFMGPPKRGGLCVVS